MASLLDLPTLSSFHLILAHSESGRGHTCTVSYMPNTKTSPHYSCHISYIHTTCHNLQRHTEHMIRTYTARWHTYLVQQYTNTRHKSKHDHEGNKTKNTCLPEQFIPLMHTYQRFVCIAYKKTVSQTAATSHYGTNAGYGGQQATTRLGLASAPRRIRLQQLRQRGDGSGAQRGPHGQTPTSPPVDFRPHWCRGTSESGP